MTGIETNPEIKTIEEKETKPFWKTISIHDLYSVITTLFVFAISLPIVYDEMSKTGGYDYISIGSLPIPRALWVVILSVALTTIVNHFRYLMTLAVIYIKNRLK